MVELEVTIVEAIIEAEVEVVETTTVIVVQEEGVVEVGVVVVIIDMTEKAVNPVFEDTEVVDGVGAAETEEEVVLVLIEIGHHLETEEDPIGTTVVECALNEVVVREAVSIIITTMIIKISISQTELMVTRLLPHPVI